MEDRFDLLHFPGRRRAGEGENAGADHRAYTQRGEAPRTERLLQLPSRTFRDGD